MEEQFRSLFGKSIKKTKKIGWKKREKSKRIIYKLKVIPYEKWRLEKQEFGKNSESILEKV